MHATALVCFVLKAKLRVSSRACVVLIFTPISHMNTVCVDTWFRRFVGPCLVFFFTRLSTNVKCLAPTSQMGSSTARLVSHELSYEKRESEKQMQAALTHAVVKSSGYSRSLLGRCKACHQK